MKNPLNQRQNNAMIRGRHPELRKDTKGAVVEMIRLLWNLLCPIFFYGLCVDLFTLLLGQQDPLAGTLAGALAAAPFLARQYMRDPPFEKRESGVDKKAWVLYVFAGIAGCFVVNTLIKMSRVSRLFSGFSRTAKAIYQSPWLLQAGAVGIGIPVAEELVFRGLVFARLRKKMDFWAAAGLSAALFALYHGNVLQGVYAFLMGLLFSWIMEREKTIGAPLVTHMAANFTSLAMTAVQGIR